MERYIEKQRSYGKYGLIQPPDMSFDDDLIGIHGITPDAVQDAPTFIDIWPEVQQRCGCGVIVAHNAAFDIGIIRLRLKTHHVASLRYR